MFLIKKFILQISLDCFFIGHYNKSIHYRNGRKGVSACMKNFAQ